MATEGGTEGTREKGTEQLREKPEIPIETETASEKVQVMHCSKCGSELTPVETPTGTRYRCPQCQLMVRPAEKEERRGEEEKGLAPLDVEARKFVVKELRERLDSVWGISSKKVGSIADTVRDNPQIALNPTALYWHIKQLCAQANDYQLYLYISGLFTRLQEKGLLGGGQQPFPVMGMGVPQMQQPAQFPFMFPHSQPQRFNPFMPFPQQQPRGLPQTPEQFEEYSDRRARARRQEEREREEHELRMAKIRKEIESMGSKETSSNVVTIVEPMRDAEGKLLKDDKGNVVFRKITGPREQIRGTTVGEDPELRMLTKMEKYKRLFGSDLDETKIKAIVKEAIPKEEVKPLTEKDVKEAAKEAALNVVAVTTEKDKEERRHRELLNAIKEGTGGKIVEGYKSDSYRFMGQGLDRLANVVEKKQPIKLVVDLVRETPPPRKEVEAGAREEIFKHVPPKYVTEE